MTQTEIAAAGGKATSIPLMGGSPEPTIFELSAPGRRGGALRENGVPMVDPASVIDPTYLREEPLALPEVSERDLVAHFTRLSHRQYSVDLGSYPLGSCTMKYNPKLADTVAGLAGIANTHPLAPVSAIQGWLELICTVEEYLLEITGMDAATFAPAAGAQGELTGLLIMRAYHRHHHRHRGNHKTKVLIPDSAHGTNPASVTLSGYEAVTVPSNSRGLVDVEALRGLIDSEVAGIMLTNPNTVGLFEEEIADIAAAIHEVDGLLYYDGANLNAIVGVARPGDMGFDIVHSNLHKTFATPHGGGGPGSGPVAVVERLAQFLPGPYPVRAEKGF
ncbi:MAG: aminomethyl-transferring glycine dehydrogenase subunit GcvPB, partial [Actinomycetota bacterium]|nr:aminomethyl-transferring glycine dehydrogenase subunit GcvPB [Actinomycetota bacterium]